MEYEHPSWDWTPREIAQWSRIKELERDVAALQGLAGLMPDRPIFEERELRLPAAVSEVRLPAIGGVEAQRAKSGMIAVKVWAGSTNKEDDMLSYRYHIDGGLAQRQFINSVLPKMHLDMMRALAKTCS